MTRNPAPVRSLRARLGALRRRIHALFLLQGLGRLLAAVVGLLAATFLADWLLDLPLGVRRFIRLGLLDRPEGQGTIAWLVVLALALLLAIWATRSRLSAAPLLAFLAGGLAGVAVWLAWRFLRPIGVRYSDEDLALSVERRYRALDDRLAAALDFDRELAHPSRGESAAMMERVIDEAAEDARKLEFAHAVSARRALWWVAAAAVSLLVAAGVTLAMADTVGLWARRSLLLEDAAWPRSTTVLAVDLDADGKVRPHDPTVAYEVAVGRPLLVRARIEGRIPDEVVLVDQVEGARSIPRRLFEVPDRPGLFAVEIRDVRQGFAFVLHAGDDTDDRPVYRVETVVPPRLLGIQAMLTFPAYLHREPEVVQGGNATVPEGTTVAVEVTADETVKVARLVAGDLVLEGRSLGDEGVRYGFDLQADQTIRYRVQLVTASGRESDPAADSYEILVEPDRPPTVRWIQPSGAVDVTADARIPLVLEVQDDHGTQAIGLEVRLADGSVLARRVVPADAPNVQKGEIAAADGPLDRKTVRVYHPLEIHDLLDEKGDPPSAPGRLAVRLKVSDSKGQTTEGPWSHFDLFVGVDLERLLGSRRSTVRASFERLLAEQRTRRDQLAAAASGPLGESEQDALRALQYAQAKMAQDLDEATRDLIRLFNSWIFNRLGAEGPVEKILGIMDEYLRRTYGRAAPEESAEPPAAPVIERGDPVFPYALYDEVARARRERVFFDTGLVDRMLQVIEPAVEAAAREAPLAHDAVRRVAAREADPKEALAAEDALIATLETTLQGMSNWKRLSDVILHLRRIIEQQTALDQRLGATEADAGGPPSPEAPGR